MGPLLTLCFEYGFDFAEIFLFKVKIIDSVISSTLLSQNLDLHVDQQHLEIVF